METISILDYQIFCGDPEKIPFNKNCFTVNTLNAYSYVIAKNDSEFKAALQSSDVLLPDGFPIVLAAKWLEKKRIKKIAGADMFYQFMEVADEKKLKVFFLGSTDATLKRIKEKVKSKYPNVITDFFSPPFKKQFSKSDNETMVDRINKAKPDILFIGMTAPKQEKWAHENKSYISPNIICSIGAVFDYFAETNTRPSEILVKLNLEWFVRLIKEPKRMWRRYLIYSPLFMRDLWGVLFLKFTNKQNR
jgi:N-acetylglucosaminyldiphosphoundecaprenol N-acetyl-beta-D-mannosaminyltransferase